MRAGFDSYSQPYFLNFGRAWGYESYLIFFDKKVVSFWWRIDEEIGYVVIFYWWIS